eukprot:8593063-Karenia_brevis.AAC.1
MWNMFKTLESIDIKGPQIDEYLQIWKWPSRLESKANCGKSMFNAKSIAAYRDAKIHKCSCSEALSVHKVIAHYVRLVALESRPAAAQAFIKLSVLIDILWNCAKLQLTHTIVARATTDFLRAYAAAWGTDDWAWKFHAVLHHSKYVQRFGWSPGTLPLERKHKMVLNIGADHCHDKCYLIRDVLNYSLSVLELGAWMDMNIGLLSPSKPSRKLNSWLQDAVGEGEYFSAAQAR